MSWLKKKKAKKATTQKHHKNIEVAHMTYVLCSTSTFVGHFVVLCEEQTDI